MLGQISRKSALFFAEGVVLDSPQFEEFRDIFTRCVRVVAVFLESFVFQPASEPLAGGQGRPCGEMTHDALLRAGLGDLFSQCPASARRSRLL